MSVDRWICLLTQEEYEKAKKEAENVYAEFWFHHCSTDTKCFYFGENPDSIPSEVFDNIEFISDNKSLYIDHLSDILEYLFLQTSDSADIGKFERFVDANLEKQKKVYFWSGI